MFKIVYYDHLYLVHDLEPNNILKKYIQDWWLIENKDHDFKKYQRKIAKEEYKKKDGKKKEIKKQPGQT